MENSQNLPNGYILLLRESCGLGTKGKLLSTHSTMADARRAAYATGCSFDLLQVKSLYEDKYI